MGHVNQKINEKPSDSNENENEFDEYHDDDEEPRTIPDVEDDIDFSGRLLNQQPAYDKLINAEIQLQLENHITTGKVKRRALGPDGRVLV